MPGIFKTCNVHAQMALPAPVTVEHTATKLTALNKIWIMRMSPQMLTKRMKIIICESAGATPEGVHVPVREYNPHNIEGPTCSVGIVSSFWSRGFILRVG